MVLNPVLGALEMAWKRYQRTSRRQKVNSDASASTEILVHIN